MARYVKVRRQGRMVWLDKETGKTSVKKPTTPTTTTPKNKTPTKTPTNTSSSGGSSSYNKNVKWLKDAALRQQAAGMSPRIKPGKTQLGGALAIGAALGEAYKRTNRAPAVSNRGEGRATFTEKKKTEDKKTETTNTSTPSSKDSKGDTYTVSGVTYSRKTGRPIKVSENRQPVQAQDNRKKDTGSGGDSSSSSSSSPPRRTSSSSSSSSTPPSRRGAGEKTPLSGGAGGTRPPGTRGAEAKAKKVKERKTYLQTKEGGGLSKRMAGALADKDALKFKPSEDKPKRKPDKTNRSKWRR